MAAPAIALKGVSKSYGRGLFRRRKISVLRDICLELSAGEIVALLGANGTGKTTLLKLVAGLVVADVGDIRVGGQRVPSARARRLVGMASGDERGLHHRLTARENLTLFGALMGVDRADIEREIDILGDELALSAFIDQPVARLSTGMRSRVALSRALLARPSVLLLDEPTKSLDSEHTQRVRHLIVERARSGTGILVATHAEDEPGLLGARRALLRDGSLDLENPAGRQ